MRYMVEVKKSPQPWTRIIAGDMQIGELGIKEDGAVVLQTFLGIVSLSDPETTWSKERKSAGRFNVEPLPPGTIITLKVNADEES